MTAETVLPEAVGPCVLWTGPFDADGYGKQGSRKAHSVAWEAANGPIPKGLELDHLCSTRACVNVAHLDLVTHAENIRRMVARGNHWKQQVTHCPAGHAYDDPEHGVTWSGHRYCLTCRREQDAQRRASGGRGLTEFICVECGKLGRKVPSSTQRFCSRACKGAAQDRKVRCVLCGTQLPPLSGRKKTCSRQCEYLLRSQRRGEANNVSRLTDENVREIRLLLAQGQSQARVAKRFGVAQTTVGKIQRGVTWSHVA
ncbi:MAG: HNH endonuclease [Chloroflexi bacterium]|nr:HNH endonuclease [Chloroflexota bacterium]